LACISNTLIMGMDRETGIAGGEQYGYS